MRWRFDVDELRMAVRTGDVERVEVALEQSPEWVHRRDRHGRSLLWTAALEGYNGHTRRLVSLVQVLLDAGAQPDLFDAAVLDQPAVMADLLTRVEVATADGEGMQALHHAAARGTRACTEVLLAAGADPSATDRLGRQPIHHAAEGGAWKPEPAIDVARALIAAGASAGLEVSVALCDPDLVAAALSVPGGHERVVVPDARGNPLAVLAARAGCAGVLQMLVDAGASVNTPGRFGRTPLIAAACALGERDTRAAITVLVERGASRSDADHRGWTAAHYAHALGHVELARWLRV